MRSWFLIATVLFACSQNTEDSPDASDIPPEQNWSRDIVDTALALDIATQSGTADIRFAASNIGGASLEIGDTRIGSVTDEDGEALDYNVDGASLHLAIDGNEQTLSIDYSYETQSGFEGATDDGVTFTWPYYCGNLFPCKSTPQDGTTFQVALTGIPSGEQLVAPTTIPADAPSYMLAWAVGDYTYEQLGTTSSGTEVGVWYLPGSAATAAAGTEHLVAAMDFYETTYGAYIFGPAVASVEADWGPGVFGGMEHHPYWHVGSSSFGDVETHVHEAAHGWFGNGIRIQCWQDFVLSEGVVSYLTARAIEAVAGVSAGDAVWANYQNDLNFVQAGNYYKIAWPDGCGDFDVLIDGLFVVPYSKGAFFMRALENRIGRTAMDSALAEFYRLYQGRSASLQDLLDTITVATNYDPSDCATLWLRAESVPASDTCE